MQNAFQTNRSLEECIYLFILENYHEIPFGEEKTMKIKDRNIYQLEDIENAAYLVATCTIMIDVFFFQLRDVKLAYCNKNEGHANCSISCTG